MITVSIRLFDSLTRRKRTDERRLMIDILAAGHWYKRHEITGAGNICESHNPADGLTELKYIVVLDEVFCKEHIVRMAKI